MDQLQKNDILIKRKLNWTVMINLSLSTIKKRNKLHFIKNILDI